VTTSLIFSLKYIGEKEKTPMKKSIKYTDGDIGNINIIEDFVPSPKALVFKEEAKKR